MEKLIFIDSTWTNDYYVCFYYESKEKAIKDFYEKYNAFIEKFANKSKTEQEDFFYNRSDYELWFANFCITGLESFNPYKVITIEQVPIFTLDEWFEDHCIEKE